MSQVNLLQNIYLFKSLTQEELNLVNDICEVEAFNPGDDIFRQNDDARALYVIKFGSVKIHTKSQEGDNIEIANLGTGSHFGEMALLDDEKRSASATAIERSDIIKINYENLTKLLEATPTIAVHFYHELSKFLCGRLRITTNDLSFVREQNLRHF